MENLVSKKAVEAVEGSERVRVISHHDADGISAAAILLTALLRKGKSVHLSIEKCITPELIEKLNKEDLETVIFSDFGSGYLNLLGDLKCRNLIICDHHQIRGEYPKENLYHITPLLAGMDEDEISGAGVSYLLAKSLDPRNSDLSYMALIGAIGDIQEENWVMKGLNERILEEAVKQGMVFKEKGVRLFGRSSRPIHKALEYSTDPYIPGITGNPSAAIQLLTEIGIELKDGERWRTLEDLSDEEMRKLNSAIIKERIRNGESDAENIFGDVYRIEVFPVFRDAREFATALNACGRMGEAGIGVLACMGLEEAQKKLMGIMNGYRKLLGSYLNWLRESDSVERTENAIYILAGRNIHENFIGTVTSIALKSGLFEDLPLIGFADAED
ncbi:MAG: hypothetical protein DRP11_04610, partial [Candidatus Aenigmatarchaeota archaeon]